MRDSLKDQAYWSSFIEDANDTVEMFSTALANTDKSARDRLRFARAAHVAALEKTVALYSSGSAADVMVAPMRISLQALSKFNRICLEDVETAREEYGGGYDRTYRLLGLAVLLNLPTEETAPIAEYIDFFGDSDEIWEAMLLELGHSGRKNTNALVWPEAYSELREALISPGPKNAKALSRFVKEWYAEMSDTAWHDNHKSKHDTYFGYWTFEAAAVAKMRNIDLSQVSAHPNFPSDIVR